MTTIGKTYSMFYRSHLENLENRRPNNFVCKFNLFTCTNPNQPSVLHQRPRVPFYDMGRKKVPCSHYVLRWNVLLVKMMVRKLEWLSHNGIDIGNCSVQQCYKVCDFPWTAGVWHPPTESRKTKNVEFLSNHCQFWVNWRVNEYCFKNEQLVHVACWPSRCG